MVHYEAVVTSLLPNDKVEILIQPDRTGDPNAPACHCGSKRTMFRIEALNRAGAQVGDWVSVSRDSSYIVRNIGALIGIPLAGLIAGVALGTFWGGTARIVLSLTGTLLGILAGVLSYRRMPANSLFVIERVIQSRKELATMYSSQSNTGRDRADCQKGCASCRPY